MHYDESSYIDIWNRIAHNTHILTYQTIFCIINLYIDIWNHTMQYEPYDNSIKEIKEEEKKGPKMTKLNVSF